MNWLLVAAGLALVAVALVDVFLVVLYLSGGIGLLTPLVSSVVWHGLRGLARLLPAARERVLSLAGPLLLVATAVGWGLLVLLAAPSRSGRRWATRYGRRRGPRPRTSSRRSTTPRCA